MRTIRDCTRKTGRDNDCTILVSGGIHGQPEGTRSGAKAVMQAIETSMEGVDLSDYARKNKELPQALLKLVYYSYKYGYFA